ncbi:MAG TPA: peptidase E [Gaiellaceae bacterium]
MNIVGLGGGADSEEGTAKLLAFVTSLTDKTKPRICFVPTAAGDATEAIVRFYETWEGRGELTHVKFFPWPPPNLRELALAQDVIVVSGGNTANMLAIWRLQGFDAILREAWEAGIVLTGGSAGMICWFEAAVTDSFGPQLEGLRDGLGFLQGSACPHYDGEELRRPTYRRLVDEGFPPGVAADDGVALHYVGTELEEAVSVRPGAQAYRVEPGSETPIEARQL